MLYDNLRNQQRRAPLFQLSDLYKSNMKLYLMESFYQNVADLLPAEEHEFVKYAFSYSIEKEWINVLFFFFC